MKKRLCALLTLLLCAPALAAAEISLSPAGTFSNYAYFEDDCALVIDANEDYLEGLFDLQGNELIPCAYESLSGYGVEGYYVAQTEEGLNVRGALDARGSEVIPFQYGDILFLSERWAVGVTLEVTSIQPCDYEDYIDDLDYNAVSYDVYDLSGPGYVGYFTHQGCEVIRAHGDYLYVQNRDGDVAIYDENLRLVRDGLASPYNAYATENGDVVCLSTGAVILPGHRFGAELGAGRLSVSDDRYKIGVCDLEGNLLTDCEYDAVYGYDANGFARVEKDEKCGLIDLDGNLVVPCEFDGIEYLRYGSGYTSRVGGYSCVQRDGAYNYAGADGALAFPVDYKNVTIVGLSMVLTDNRGQLFIAAADGTLTRTDYAAISPFPGGDGTLLKAQDESGQWHLIDWHGNELTQEALPYAVSALIAADGSAVLIETDGGKTAYTVQHT